MYLHPPSKFKIYNMTYGRFFFKLQELLTDHFVYLYNEICSVLRKAKYSGALHIKCTQNQWITNSLVLGRWFCMELIFESSRLTNNNDSTKIQWVNLRIFISRATGPISTKFGTKHPWVKEVQFRLNEMSCLNPKRYINKIAKIHL